MDLRNVSVTIAVIVLVGCCVISCSEDEGTGPQVLESCTGPVTVSVTVADEVVIDWTPTCKLFFLNVEPQGSGRDMWNIVTDSVNAIAPPVTYGVTPAGAVARSSAGELTPGMRYNVYLFRWTGPGRQDGELIGKGEFTR